MFSSAFSLWSMISVTEFERVANVVSSVFRRLLMDSSKVLILVSSEVSRCSTRPCSVVSNCASRWSIEAVISPPLEVTRLSKLST